MMVSIVIIIIILLMVFLLEIFYITGSTQVFIVQFGHNLVGTSNLVGIGN